MIDIFVVSVRVCMFFRFYLFRLHFHCGIEICFISFHCTLCNPSHLQAQVQCNHYYYLFFFIVCSIKETKRDTRVSVNGICTKMCIVKSKLRPSHEKKNHTNVINDDRHQWIVIYHQSCGRGRHIATVLRCVRLTVLILVEEFVFERCIRYVLVKMAPATG